MTQKAEKAIILYSLKPQLSTKRPNDSHHVSVMAGPFMLTKTLSFIEITRGLD